MFVPVAKWMSDAPVQDKQLRDLRLVSTHGSRIRSGGQAVGDQVPGHRVPMGSEQAGRLVTGRRQACLHCDRHDRAASHMRQDHAVPAHTRRNRPRSLGAAVPGRVREVEERFALVRPARVLGPLRKRVLRAAWPARPVAGHYPTPDRRILEEHPGRQGVRLREHLQYGVTAQRREHGEAPGRKVRFIHSDQGYFFEHPLTNTKGFKFMGADAEAAKVPALSSVSRTR
jgi:hypothetical protein